MLLILFFYSTILLIAGQAKGGITIDQTTCSQQQTATIQNALQEIVDMSSAAHGYVQAGLNNELNLLGPLGIVALNTFLTYFGSENSEDKIESAQMLLGKCFYSYPN